MQPLLSCCQWVKTIPRTQTALALACWLSLVTVHVFVCLGLIEKLHCGFFEFWRLSKLRVYVYVAMCVYSNHRWMQSRVHWCYYWSLAGCCSVSSHRCCHHILSVQTFLYPCYTNKDGWHRGIERVSEAKLTVCLLCKGDCKAKNQLG